MAYKEFGAQQLDWKPVPIVEHLRSLTRKMPSTRFENIRNSFCGNNILTLQNGEEQVRVVFCGNGTWRIRFDPSWKEVDVPTYNLLDEPDALPLQIREACDHLVVQGDGGSSLVVHRNPFRVEFRGAHGQSMLSTHPQLPFRVNDRSKQCDAWFLRGEEDVYFGLGERTGPLVKNGRMFRFGAGDAICHSGDFHDPLYKNIPFLMGANRDTKQYWGLFLRTAWEGTIDLGCFLDGYYAASFHVRLEGGPIDFYWFAGPTPHDVIEQYTRLSGRTLFPPKYTLGYLASGFDISEHKTAQADILAFARQTHELDLPCDGWHLSSGYTVLPGTDLRCVFTWNNERFPDPTGWVHQLRELGIRVAANIKPAMLETHPQYEEVKTEGLFIANESGEGPLVVQFWGGRGSFLDFTNSKTREWWRSNIRKQLLEKGIEGVWNDNCEYSIYEPEGQCNNDGEAYPIGGLRTIQTNLMLRTSMEAWREFQPGKRPWNVARAGWTGLQALAQTWSGDNTTSWEDLRRDIPIGLGMGLSGVANESHDVGGFAGPHPSPELFVRWCHAGIFMPRFTIHSGESRMDPWTHPEVYNHVRDAIRLRYRLIPLLYSLFRQAALTGDPIQRPFAWSYPDQPQLWSVDDQFLFGDHLLMAPVYKEGARQWPVKLPTGNKWIDWFTGEVYAGGQMIAIPAPLDRPVLLLRDGGIVPMQKPLKYIGAETIEDLELHLAMPDHGNSSFTLYEDDGESYAYQDGVYHQRVILLQKTSANECLVRLETPEGTFKPTWKTLTLYFVSPVKEVNYQSQKIKLEHKGIRRKIQIPYPIGEIEIKVIM